MAESRIRDNYTTRLPCDLSLITMPAPHYRQFSDMNISQGSVVTYVRCGGILNGNALQFYQWICQRKNFENWPAFGKAKWVCTDSCFESQCTLRMMGRDATELPGYHEHRHNWQIAINMSVERCKRRVTCITGRQYRAAAVTRSCNCVNASVSHQV